MRPDQARAIAQEAIRRENLLVPPYVKTLHEKQRIAWDDPARFKALQCGRRGGKTTLALCKIAFTANLHDKSVSCFLGLTRESAKRLAWKPLMEMNEEFGWGWRFNKVEMIAYCPNGSQVWILGADKESDIDKIRGPSYHMFVIDEAGFYRDHLRELVQEVVEPALGDHRGELWMIGSPGPICRGMFYDITKGDRKKYKKWSVHKWTVLDNTHFNNPTQWLADTLEENDWTESTPQYIREYLGRWFKDASYMVYRFDEAKNLTKSLPNHISEYDLVLGLDFGVVDACAFTVWAFREKERVAYIIRSYKVAGLAPSDFSNHIVELREKFGELTGRRPDEVFRAIVADTPGIGKAFARELEKQEGIYVKTAEKSDKLVFIEYMNGDFHNGHVKLLEGQTEDLRNEYEILEWKNDRRDKYDDRAEDHNADSALYPYRYIRHYWCVSDNPGKSETEAERLNRQQEEEEAEMDRRRRLERELQSDVYGDGLALEDFLI